MSNSSFRFNAFILSLTNYFVKNILSCQENEVHFGFHPIKLNLASLKCPFQRKKQHIIF